MFAIVIKLRLHLNKDNDVDNVLSYVSLEKDFRD